MILNVCVHTVMYVYLLYVHNHVIHSCMCSFMYVVYTKWRLWFFSRLAGRHMSITNHLQLKGKGKRQARTDAVNSLFARDADDKRWELNPLSPIWERSKEYVTKKTQRKGQEGCQSRNCFSKKSCSLPPILKGTRRLSNQGIAFQQKAVPCPLFECRHSYTDSKYKMQFYNY